MKASDGHEFLDFLLDQLADVPELRAQRMFGGTGLYSADLFFGIVYGDVAYFKVDDINRSDYMRAGMKPFKPARAKPMKMQYYEVPAAVIEDAEEACRWARRALGAAERKAAASTARGK